MKPFSLNHLELALIDSRHNFFHWATVVSIRLIFALILIPLSLYLTLIGFLLSADTIKPYLPVLWFQKATFYADKLPHALLIKDFIFTKLDYWYQDAPIWWTMVVGIPLMTMGICLCLIEGFNLYHSIFSSLYNRTHCPFCKQAIKARKKLA